MTQETIKLEAGHSTVKVWRREVNEKTGKEITKQINEGIAVKVGTSFARVFNMAPVDDGGDVNPETTEWFPIAGKNSWIEITGRTKDKFAIPPVLR